MRTYNAFAGSNLDRLAALSDGLFAIAMTILTFDIKPPQPASIHSEAELLRAIGGLAAHGAPLLMSYLTLAIFWIGQQTQLNHFARVDRRLALLHLLFLLMVTLLPFSTSLLAAFITFRTALLVYWVNFAMMGFALYVSWSYADRNGLVKEAAEHESKAIRRRIILAQAWYFAGMLLCLINNYWSFGFIVTVQMIYVIGPRWAWLNKITG